jgi:site-specific DNA-methyltransferase (adenine-specific)
LVDYTNAKDCFPQNSISGGVCYFARESRHKGKCHFINIRNGKSTIAERPLNEFPVLVRYNEAVEILHKTRKLNEHLLQEIVSSLTPYGLPTNYRGHDEKSNGDLTLYSSEGISYMDKKDVTKGFDSIEKYKVMISKMGAEHAGEPSKDGMFRVLTSTMRVLMPNEVCTHSYFVIGPFNRLSEGENLLSYLRTKFVRFLIMQCMSAVNLSKAVFAFVPLQDFSHPWTDEMLYKKYGLTEEEITFIESMIRPME